jgi:filamentous hemagglutinin family protein
LIVYLLLVTLFMIMKFYTHIWGFLLSQSLSFIYSSILEPAVLAQIIQDATLPTPSIVIQDGKRSIINGGTRAGGNLFHSLKEFSVPIGGTAYFNNTLDVQNIISRVTGQSISNIDGLIRVNGTANLFLINPNGIVFGQNARLDIGGSFLASTASSLKFTDNLEFSATNPNSAPLLSINLPMGLQYGSNIGTIRLQGTGHNLTGLAFSPVVRSNNLKGLQVQPGKTLALVGGNLILEGGVITAEGGRIELGSVGNNGLVNITPTTSGWNLEYKNVPFFQNISLSKRALADASGTNTGSIQIQGHRVTLTDGSVVLIQNQGLLPTGTLEVNASESLDISGTDPIAMIAGSLRNEAVGLGKAGDIEVSTKHLILRDGGQINALTFSAATSGNIIVKSSDSIQLLGVSPRNPGVFSAISAATFNSGEAGDITVSTGKLVATQGGALTSSTFGTGHGGDVIVNATDSIAVIGSAPIIFNPSVLSATSFNTGNAGNLTLNTARLVVRDGGRIDASTLASGDSGSVTINARNSVEISGTIPGSGNPSLVISSANIESQTLQKLFRLPAKPSGKSGDVTINTDQLSVTNGAQLTVSNDGFGDAGKLQINANTINVTNDGSIAATTAIGQGGNIDMYSNILLLNNGNISATAGEQGSNGNGGNITIDTDALLVLGNSAITANAFGGRGGNIWINADGFFFSGNSRVEASSQFGLNGTVQINGLGIEYRSIKAVPELVQETPKMASGCAAQSGTGRKILIVGGSNSPPPDSDEQLYSQPFVQRNSVWFESSEPLRESQPLIIKETTKIVEAQGWIIDSKGNVELVATPPDQAPYNSFLATRSCSSVGSATEVFPSVETKQSND